MSANVSQTAGLPMYDPPELHGIVDAWWGGLARAFRAEGIPNVPDRLDRSLSLNALWGAPALLLTQTCGFPLFGSWADRLQYLATPRYAAPGCAGADYCSWVVVNAKSPVHRIDDLRGARCSISARISHSGYNALRGLIAPLAARSLLRIGQRQRRHAESLAQLERGEVDVAAIDCVTYALLERCRPHVIAATQIIGRTASAPGLPYATRIGAGAQRIAQLRAGLVARLRRPDLRTVRNALLIDGLESSIRCLRLHGRDGGRREAATIPRAGLEGSAPFIR
jgi:hypothetical protein